MSFPMQSSGFPSLAEPEEPHISISKGIPPLPLSQTGFKDNHMCSAMRTSVSRASQLLIPSLAKAPWINCLVAPSVKAIELAGVQANFKEIICMNSYCSAKKSLWLTSSLLGSLLFICIYMHNCMQAQSCTVCLTLDSWVQPLFSDFLRNIICISIFMKSWSDASKNMYIDVPIYIHTHTIRP